MIDTTFLRLRLWPFLLGHFSSVLLIVLSSFVLLCQAQHQWSCSQSGVNRGGRDCQLLCNCRTYPPLPPPPPPPPPPRVLFTMGNGAEPSVPLLRPWWMEIIVVGTIGSALAVFLLLTVIICYKAIKRKPLKKERNGASCGEYAMSSFKKKTNNTSTNNAVV